MENLYGTTLARLREICRDHALPPFAAGQIARWLYVRRAAGIDSMTDLSRDARRRLAQHYEARITPPLRTSVSADGTKKYLFGSAGDGYIEAACIPDGERTTLCVSSQVGCRMGCRFCATGRQGLRRSLTAGEIINQILSIPESGRLTNIVFMGMGEPLDNYDNVLAALEILTAPWGMAWSPTRITLSTAGVTPRLEQLLLQTKVHVAVSLHNPFHDQRAEIMPIELAYPVRELARMLRRHDFSGQRRLSFEYILMEGLNDSPAHIRELRRLLNGLKCRINIIRFHRIPDSPYFSPPRRKMEAFRDALTAGGIHTTIRASRGEDIQAACGLLSTAEAMKRAAPDDTAGTRAEQDGAARTER